MSFCLVDSCYICIVYLIMIITYFNADILENCFSNVIVINELEGGGGGCVFPW